MRDLWKPLAIVALVLAVPILPFALAGEWFEERFASGVRGLDEGGNLFAAVVAVLALDVFLPVPSSGVGTVAGAKLGIALGTTATWLGLTLGGVVGFAVARQWGKPLAERLAGRDDLARLEVPAHRFGPWLVLVSRPLPIVAEASVLLLGTTRLDWRAFWWPLATGNLVVSVIYAALGDVAQRYDWLAPAVLLVLLLPLVLTWGIRKLLPFSQ
jgi:uncharacterized membrane protein YdjX (TVP38/TMEM64 family)